MDEEWWPRRTCGIISEILWKFVVWAWSFCCGLFFPDSKHFLISEEDLPMTSASESLRQCFWSNLLNFFQCGIIKWPEGLIYALRCKSSFKIWQTGWLEMPFLWVKVFWWQRGFLWTCSCIAWMFFFLCTLWGQPVFGLSTISPVFS